MQENSNSSKKYDDNAPFYRQPIFWMLMSGPIIVIIAAFASFGLAKSHAQDMVTDDYYKDGKHINLQLDRDQHAIDRDISAQIMFNPENTAAKVFINGKFEPKDGVNLLLMHPSRQTEDRKIVLQTLGEHEFNATFEALPKTVHWYVRLEDGKGVWRIEQKWLPSQGNTLMIKASLPTNSSALAPTP